MIRIVKHTSNDGNIDFEFLGADCWEDFEVISEIIVNTCKASIISNIEGIYSKHTIYAIEDKQFRLMYHEDTGNCLCPMDLTDDNVSYVSNIAESIVLEIQEKLERF